jgi:hypothetical protein
MELTGLYLLRTQGFLDTVSFGRFIPMFQLLAGEEDFTSTVLYSAPSPKHPPKYTVSHPRMA